MNAVKVWKGTSLAYRLLQTAVNRATFQFIFFGKELNRYERMKWDSHVAHSFTADSLEVGNAQHLAMSVFSHVWIKLEWTNEYWSTQLAIGRWPIATLAPPPPPLLNFQSSKFLGKGNLFVQPSWRLNQRSWQQQDSTLDKVKDL